LNRKELQDLSRIRLREAQALAKLGMSDGAYYLGGYCVECALKACIAKFTERHEFPDKKRVDASYSHNFTNLIKVAGLEDARTEEAKRDAAFQKNWDTVEQWSERSRYLTNDAETAGDLIEAVGSLRHGVLRWVKRHW
jgi:hypothetical protein